MHNIYLIKISLMQLMLSLGVALTGGSVGMNMGGDGTGVVRASNVLGNNSYILFDGIVGTNIIFRCSTGLGPSGSDTNNDIGDVYYYNMALTDGQCFGGFVQVGGDPNMARYPGVYRVEACSPILTTSAEGVYTCILRNSSMMNQSLRVGLYFSGRSESFYHNWSFCYY